MSYRQHTAPSLARVLGVAIHAHSAVAIDSFDPPVDRRQIPLLINLLLAQVHTPAFRPVYWPGSRPVRSVCLLTSLAPWLYRLSLC